MRAVTTALFAAALACSGCILTPGVGGTQCGLRDLRTEELRGQTPLCLLPGVASREDVLTTLGVPQGAFERGDVLVYHGSSIEFWFVLIGNSSSIVLSFGQDYVLLVRFGRDGRVVRHQLFTTGLRGAGAALPGAYSEFGVRF